MIVQAVVEYIRFGKVLHPVEELADEQPGQDDGYQRPQLDGGHYFLFPASSDNLLIKAVR